MALILDQSVPIAGVSQHVYDNLDENDSAPATIVAGGSSVVAGSIQAVGTFGGGTLRLQGSNNGSDWVNLTGLDGEVLGLTSAGLVEFSTAALYIRPLISGSGADVDVFIVLRG